MRAAIHVNGLVSLGLLLFASAVGQAQKPELVVQSGHANVVNSVAFAADGKMLASGSTDNTIKLWEVATGRELRTLTGHTEAVSSVAFNPDGKTLASGGWDALKLWDVASGRELRTLSRHAGWVYSVAFSPDGKMLASSGWHETIKLWEVATGKELHTLTGHSGLITSVAFSPDGLTLASGSMDHTIKLWRVDLGRELRTLAGDLPVSSVAFGAHGILASSSIADNTVKLWDVTTGRELRELTGHSQDVFTVSFSADGRTLASGSRDETIKLWEVATGRELRTLTGHFRTVTSVAFSPDGQTLASGGSEIRLWEVATGRELRALSGHSLPVFQVAFSPDGRRLATGAGSILTNSAVKLWEIATGRELRTLARHSGVVVSVAFSVDGRILASGSMDQTIKLWDVRAGEELRTLAGHSKAVVSLSFSADGKTLASGSWDHTIKMWEVATGKELRTLAGHSAEVLSVAFSPDGETLASCSMDKTIKLWEVATGRELHSLARQDSYVTTVVFSPDGKSLASGGWDNAIRLWEIASWREFRLLSGHSGPVSSIAFSADGKTLASGSYDQTIKLWEVATGRELHTLTGHSGSITSVALGADGRLLVSGGADGSTRLWHVDRGELLASLMALDETDWAVVAPDGLFDGSPGAWNKMIWRSALNTLDYLPVEAYFSDFYYPGLLTDILAGKGPKAQRDISRRDRRQPLVTIRLAKERAPTAGSSAAAVEAVAERRIAMRVSVIEAAGGKDQQFGSGARDVRLFRNGSLVKVWHGDAFTLVAKDGCQQLPADIVTKARRVVCEIQIPIVGGENRLTAYAFNNDNVKSKDAELAVAGAESLKRTGALYVLAIGVGRYENSQYNLNYTAADAQDFGAEVKREQEKLDRYGRVEVIPLFDQSATKAKILAALQKLAEAVQPEDGVIVYFSGHGTAQGDRFYLIPHDIGYTGSRKELSTAGLQEILAHSISDVELEAAFRTLDAGQLLLIIDACNSGKALQADDWRRGPMNTRGLGQLAYEKGMYILTASQDVELAYESEALKHSYLTYALVEEGLKTAAADKEPTDGQVMLREWFDYAMREVPQLRRQKVEQEAKKQGKTLEEVEVVEHDRVQQPRVFYRREPEARPFVVTKVGATKYHLCHLKQVSER